MRQTLLFGTRVSRTLVPFDFLLAVLALGLLAACSTKSASEPKSTKIDLEQSQSDAAAKAAKELEAQKKAEAEKEAEEAKKKADARFPLG